MPKVSKAVKENLPAMVTRYLETIVDTNSEVTAKMKDMTEECLGKLKELAMGVLVEQPGNDGPTVYKLPPNVQALTTILKLTTTTPVEASIVAKNMSNENAKSPEELELMRARAELAIAEKNKIQREIEMMNSSMISEDIATEVIMAVCNSAVAFIHGLRLEQMPKTEAEKATLLQRFVLVIGSARDEALGVLDDAKSENALLTQKGNDDGDEEDVIDV